MPPLPRPFTLPPDFEQLQITAKECAFAEVEESITEFLNRRKSERRAAKDKPKDKLEENGSSTKKQEVSWLLHTCLMSGVNYMLKCEFLVSAGADMDFIPPKSKHSMLTRAVSSGKPALVHLLLESGARVNNDGLRGSLPVCVALALPEACAMRMLQHLEKFKVKFDVVDPRLRFSPFELAVAANMFDAVQLIAKGGGAYNLTTVASQVKRQCNASCGGRNCNSKMLLQLVGLGASVKVIKRYNAGTTTTYPCDGTVVMCFVGHEALDLALRNIFEETKFVVMMALFKLRDAAPILDIEEGVRRTIFNAVFCDRRQHPYILQDGVEVQRGCSLQLCGRQVKEAAFPFAVLTVPPERLVFDDDVIVVE